MGETAATSNGRQITPYEEFRVRNFKLRQVRLQIDDKGGTRVLQNKKARFKQSYLDKMHLEEIDALDVMTLEGLWCLRLTPAYPMYTIITDLYRQGTDEADEMLFVLLTNMLCASSIPDGLYQSLLSLACESYAESVGDQQTWSEKRAAYDKLLDKYKWTFDAQMEGYKKGEPKDLTDEEYSRAETADDAQSVISSK